MIWHHIPQIIVLALLLAGVTRTLEHFGETKKPDTFGLGDLLGSAIMFMLLWWGGYFG